MKGRYNVAGLTRMAAGLLAVLVLWLSLGVAPATAATITVDNGAVDIKKNNVCSLTEALANANDTATGRPYKDCVAGDPAGADTISLPINGRFTLLAAMPEVDFGLPLVDSEITVNGNGATILRDSIAPLFRFFVVGDGGNLTLNDLTLIGGDVGDQSGGAIQAFFGATLNLNRCTLDSNRAQSGAAIKNDGTVNIVDSTITHGSASSFIGAGVGGVAWNEGTMTITGSLLAENWAARLGGAIHNNGVLDVTNSTFFGNDSGFRAGGISNSGTTTLTNVTMTNNTADLEESGGAVYNDEFATLTLHRSLFTDNWAEFDENEIANADGTVIANAYNLFGHNHKSHVTGFKPKGKDIVPAGDLDSILEFFPAGNGGMTQTIALVDGSPAIDAAPTADCVPAPVDNVDQRRRPRGVDGDDHASSKECDIGAYEEQGESSGPKIYASPTTSGFVSGIGVTPLDILAYDTGFDGWETHFQGSDVGVTKPLAAFAHMPDGSLLLSFKANQTISGIGVFTPWDVARFVPATLGSTTDGWFEWYLDGSDVGLTTAAEKIDALDALDDGRVLISTMGTSSVPKPGGGVLRSEDEDLSAFTPATTGATTSGTWALYFDGTAVSGLGTEDVAGAAVDETAGDLYLTVMDVFDVGGVSGDGKDVLKLSPSGGSYTVTHFWRGPDHGFDMDIAAIELE